MDYHLIVLEGAQAQRLLPKTFGNHLVYNANANFYNAYQTPYTIKYVASGEKYYQTGETTHRLTANKFLILNDKCKIECLPGRVERSLSVFIAPALLQDVRHVHCQRELAILDAPVPWQTEPLTCIEQVQDARDLALGVYLQALLRRIGTVGKPYQPSGETFVELAHLLLFTQDENYQRLEKLQSVRQSTRLELLRRLEQGRSYLLDHWNEEVPLAEVAQVAQLSPYHFHRRWREAFGETPRQFVERLRIEYACQMLREARFNITEIALRCGFSDLAAFSNVFKKRRGKSPKQWRSR